MDLYVNLSLIISTYSELPGSKPPLKDSEVVDEQAATEGVLHVQTDQPAKQQPPHLQQGERRVILTTHTPYIQGKMDKLILCEMMPF